MTDSPSSPVPPSAAAAPEDLPAHPQVSSPAPAPAGPPPILEISPETFWAVVLRRSRYAVAIGISALVFCTLGWMVASPAPQLSGISLVSWQHHGLFSGVLLVIMLLLLTAICSLLVHPDSPHMGLFCALTGMAGLAIRGGTIHSLLEFAQRPMLAPELTPLSYSRLSDLLAVECLEWGVMLLIADTFARIIHDRFLTNTQWIMRSASDPVRELGERHIPAVGTAMGISLTVSKALRTHDMKRRVATPLVMLYSGVIAMLLLYILMQSQAKGQVLMACFVTFYISTLCGYLAFPRVPITALLVMVPIVAAAGYLYGRNLPPAYPGHASFFIMRALPIDYFTAGVPGAILGFYSAFRMSLHSHEAPS